MFCKTTDSKKDGIKTQNGVTYLVQIPAWAKARVVMSDAYSLQTSEFGALQDELI